MLARLPAQFITWSGDKVPTHPVTGLAIDPHDPAQWMTREAAMATGRNVGFVFTANDPYFFIDLDKCREGDDWRPEAREICARFAGAAMEVSQSGRGLHIMGRCDKARVGGLRNKWNGWCEFYTERRFIAFGPHGWQGDPNTDHTAAILATVPAREHVDVTAHVGPDPTYTGPTDDEELLRMMRASRGSMAQMFGAKATFAELWDRDEAALARHFPSPSGGTFDHSSADASLMSMLAFWTGRDGERMERLFRRSGLMRDKFDRRPDYRAATIQNACAGTKTVYNVTTDAAPVLGGGDDAPAPGVEFLTLQEQLKHFAGCVYVRDIHRILIPDGALLKSEQFNATYGGYTFQMSGDSSGSTKKAFEAFTESRMHKFPRVATTRFRPSQPFGAVIDDAVNVYRPIEPVTRAGDASPFLDLLARLLPAEQDRAILLAYAAACVQHIGVKFQWAPVVQGTEGNGKTLIMRCVEYAIGERYSHFPAANDLGNAFNAYLENKLFIGVEEIHLDGRRELLDTLKPLITNSRIEVQAKGVDKRMIDNYANWWFNTNYRDAVVKTESDRRYAVLFTAQQSHDDIIRDGMGGAYFPQLWNWLRAEGFAIVAHYLRTYPIPDELNPAGNCNRAPRTTSQAAAVVASMGRAEQELHEAIESGEAGFRGGWVSTHMLDALLRDKGVRMGPQKRARMLEDMGFVEVCRASRPLLSEQSKRPVLYARKGIMGGTEEYCAAQGYREYF